MNVSFQRVASTIIDNTPLLRIKQAFLLRSLVDMYMDVQNKFYNDMAWTPSQSGRSQSQQDILARAKRATSSPASMSRFINSIDRRIGYLIKDVQRQRESAIWEFKRQTQSLEMDVFFNGHNQKLRDLFDNICDSFPASEQAHANDNLTKEEIRLDKHLEERRAKFDAENVKLQAELDNFENTVRPQFAKTCEEFTTKINRYLAYRKQLQAYKATFKCADLNSSTPLTTTPQPPEEPAEVYTFPIQSAGQ